MTAKARKAWERHVSPEPNTGCWLWTASLGPKGYGRAFVGHRQRRPAHVVAWELLRGPVPDGRQLDHLCRVRSCVNPDHLEPVTNRENVLRGQGPSAQNARKTHCKRGHELNEANAYSGRGYRECRACQALWQRQKRASRRLALDGFDVKELP